MTTILVLHDDRSVDEHEFDADVRTVTIGRRPSNDVCIQDRSVSGTHARLEVREDGTWLEDLGSTNGTWLGGDGVSRRRLEDGDEVLVGKVRLKVHVLDPWAESTPASQAAVAQAVPAVAAHASGSKGDTDEDSFVEESLVTSTPDGDDDELDEDMRRALELYSGDDEEDEPVRQATGPAPGGFDRDDDEPDFAEDARLFAQPVASHDGDDGADDGADGGDGHDGRRDHDASGAGESGPERDVEAAQNRVADDSLSLSDRAKGALARQQPSRPQLRAVDSGSVRDARAPDFDDSGAPDDGEETQVEHAPSEVRTEAPRTRPAVRTADTGTGARRPLARDDAPPAPTHELDRPSARSRGAVIQIKNGAKSGQILPIDKPVTTLGRPGIQIAAIMRKPDGYFLMHIESDDAVDRPTLNSDSIGDEPVLLHSGDELNVAGIDVEFMLS